MAAGAFTINAPEPSDKDTWLQHAFLEIYSEMQQEKALPRLRAAGMMKRFALECFNKAKEVENTPVFGGSVCGSSRRHWMQSECETWMLLSTLMSDAADPGPPAGPPYGEDIPQQWRFCVSHKLLVRDFLSRNRILRRLHMILRWLEDAMYEEVRYVATPVQWPRTAQKAKADKAAGQYDAGRESWLDLDARHRDAPLDPEDTAAEDRLVVALFSLLRCGRVAEAVTLCEQAAQPWRTAAIRAQELKHCAAWAEPPSQAPRVPTERDEAEGTTQGADNPFAMKEVYRRLASNTTLHPHERALYGLATGHLESLLGVAGTWKESLWAYLRAVLTYKVDTHLTTFLGEDRYTPEWPLQNRLGGLSEDAVLMEDVLEEMEHHLLVRGLRGPHPYFARVQPPLLRLFTNHRDLHGPPALAALLRAIRDPAGDAWPARFACHLMLALATATEGDAAATAALERGRQEGLLQYLGHQQRGEHFARVSFYAALLPPELRARPHPEFRVQSFPEFLAHVQELDRLRGDGGTARREELLYAAGAAGLDVGPLLTAAVHAARHRHQQWLADPAAVGLSMVTQPVGRILAEDWAHIEALQWLTLRPADRLRAVAEVAASLRTFVRAEKVQAAAALAALLPPDTASVCEALLQEPGREAEAVLHRNCLREYVAWELFLRAVRAAAVWRNHWAARPPPPPPFAPERTAGSLLREVRAQAAAAEAKQQGRQWGEGERRLRDAALTPLWAVLRFPKGWLLDHAPAADPARRAELEELRAVCLPHTVALLVEIIRATQQYDMALDVLAALAEDPPGGEGAVHASFPTPALRRAVEDLTDLLVEHEQASATVP